MNSKVSEEMIQYKKNALPETDLQHLNPLKSMFLHGPSLIKQQNYGSHPLEQLEKTHQARVEYRNLRILRSVQGVHAPLRLLAEKKALSKVGHLPFLPRSNLSADVLDGRDEMILPEDVFDDPREYGESQLPPHMTVERELGIL